MNIENLYQLYKKCTGISIDTRSILPGNLFFALRGENFDGHKFIETALSKGALSVIISDKKYDGQKSFIVDDTLIALQKLANFHRKQLDIPILAITGTNGKTTTKELVMAVLATKYYIAGTKGNYNNHIGVPLTILNFSENTEIGIVEMGANHIGDIEELCKIAEPNLGIITNIANAHLEGFGSLEGVKRTKTELFRFLESNNPSSVIFYNQADKLISELIPRKLKAISYGAKNSSIFAVVEQRLESFFLDFKWKSKQSNNWHVVHTQLVGSFNLSNALAAIAIAKYFELPSKSINLALEAYLPENKRSQLFKTKRNTLIIDAYNANPVSMSKALINFSQIISDKKKIAILGDMFELGKFSSDEHNNIVKLAEKDNSIQYIFVGKEFFNHQHADFLFFENCDNLISWFKKNKLDEKIILLKASRGMKFENLVDYL